jgi:hypothetical protein
MQPVSAFNRTDCEGVYLFLALAHEQAHRLVSLAIGGQTDTSVVVAANIRSAIEEAMEASGYYEDTPPKGAVPVPGPQETEIVKALVLTQKY